jgi:dTMP kinase
MFIAIEGIDGSGKGTQTALLARKAKQAGLIVHTITFPGYDRNCFGQAVGRYLNGEFGNVNQVAPELAALLYAGDRFASRQVLVDALRTKGLVIADRYVPSNLAHQGAKLSPDERPAFISWLSTIEYDIYSMPHADLTVYLDLPVPLAMSLVLKKKQRDYTTLKADIHEQDMHYLERCREVFELLAVQNHGGDWIRVPCSRADGLLREPADICDSIWRIVLERKERILCDNRAPTR